MAKGLMIKGGWLVPQDLRDVPINPKLRFVYPYAQAIGFLLERSGMREAAERFSREFPPSVQFFADHSAKSTWTYNERWMLYHPPGL